MNKKSALAVAIAAATLVGCNSSSDSDDNGSTNPTSFTVIDGYINNAVICARESVETACAYSTTTDAKGQFTLPPEYADMLITADVVGGLSSDSDTVGLSPRSYTMAAFENNALITPFTSIAAMSNATNLDDVAAELGVSVEDLTSDYVALNDSKVHLYARTLASQLAYKSAEDQSEHLIDIAKKTKELVEDIESEQGTDFDFSTITVDVEIDSEGNVNVDELPRISTVSDFLEISEDGQALPIYLASLNPTWFDEEDVMGLTFKDGVGGDIDDPSDEWDYEIDGTNLSIDGEEFNEFIYVSNNIALGVSLEQQDLGVFAQTELKNNGQFIDGELIGKTLYFVADDSTNKTPDPMFATLSFTDSEATISEGDDSFTVRYDIDGAGALNVYLKDHNPSDNNMQMYKSVENQHMIIGFDTSTEAFVLNFYDEDFAKKVYQDWLVLAD